MNSQGKIDGPDFATETGTLEGDERWALVFRVVGSKGFAKSERLRDFLLYVCRNALTRSAAGDVRVVGQFKKDIPTPLT